MALPLILVLTWSRIKHIRGRATHVKANDWNPVEARGVSSGYGTDHPSRWPGKNRVFGKQQLWR